jgi:ATP-binding cassette subfamily B protein
MASKKQSLDRDIIRYYWRATTRYKKEFLLSWFIPINAICSNTIAPFIVGKLLASLLLPNQQVKGYVIAFIITGITTYITNWIGFWGYMRSQAQTITDLQASTLQMLLRRGTAFHNNQVSGRLVTEALDFPSAYMQLATTFFTNVIPYVVALVSGIAIIAVSSPLLGLVVLVMTVVALGSGYRLRISMKPFREERIRRQKEVTAHFADTIVNIQAVKTFAREDEELASHKTKGKQLEKIRIKNWVSFSRSGTQRVGIVYLFQLTFILTLITLVHRNPAILGAGIFAFTYTVTLTNRLFDITSILRTFEEALVLAEPMMRAMQTTPEISDEPGAPVLTASSGEVSFRDVGFQYSDTDSNEKVFEGLQLHIKAGEKLGLVGPSGGGKSTITKLLLRFEDVQEGAIEIDGQNIASVIKQYKV